MAVLALLLAGCGGSDDEGGSKDSNDQASGPAEGARKPIPAGAKLQSLKAEPQTDANGDVDSAAYNDTLKGALATLDTFWSDTFAKDLHEKWQGPGDYIAYDPQQDDPGCGGQPAGEMNAVYCGAGGFVAWDEPNLMIPFYRDKGDMAVGFVLAHEMGHAVQDSLGISDKFHYTIESELQADCFAGAWAGRLADEGVIDPNDKPGDGGDIDSALDAIYTVADPEGSAWNAPDAHGTGDERATAFGDGYDGGVNTCADQYAPGFADKAGSNVEIPDGAETGGAGGDNLGAGG